MRNRKKPLRKCVSCQEMMPKNTLIRIVRTPEGEVKPDPTGKSAGRGAYLCTNDACLHGAQKHNALGRALKTKIDAELYDQLSILFEQTGRVDHVP